MEEGEAGGPRSPAGGSAGALWVWALYAMPCSLVGELPAEATADSSEAISSLSPCKPASESDTVIHRPWKLASSRNTSQVSLVTRPAQGWALPETDC